MGNGTVRSESHARDTGDKVTITTSGLAKIRMGSSVHPTPLETMILVPLEL